MNYIDLFRREIVEDVAQGTLKPDEKETIYSPDRRFYFEATPIQSAVPNLNWSALQIEIFDSTTTERIGCFIRNEDVYSYYWLDLPQSRYLFLSEDYMGESVFDLNQKRLYGYAINHKEEEGFIWTEFIPSPDKSKIAIIGCYWGSDYGVIVYDLKALPSLPLPRLLEFTPLKRDNVSWLTDSKLKFYNESSHEERVISFE